MSREILFRGKRKDNGEWVEGYYEELPAYYDGTTTPKIVTPAKDTDDYNCWSFVLPDTVGQYTGLRDRNGRKIFEGDILRGKGKNVYEVVYPENIAGFVTRGTGVLSVPCMNYGTMKYYEIIGNIHDNPEMVGG